MFSFYQKRSNFFIALDGAANWALEHHHAPDLVIGDLDSFHKDLWPKVTTKYIADQNTNDLEKALQYCQSKALQRVLVLGAFGRRLDHLLTNIFAVRKFSSMLDICLADDEQVAFLAKPRENIELQALKGSWLSLFPLDARVGPITTSGVSYPLENEYLYAQKRIGTLNSINSEHAHIYCESPDLLIMLPQCQAHHFTTEL